MKRTIRERIKILRGVCPVLHCNRQANFSLFFSSHSVTVGVPEWYREKTLYCQYHANVILVLCGAGENTEDPPAWKAYSPQSSRIGGNGLWESLHPIDEWVEPGVVPAKRKTYHHLTTQELERYGRWVDRKTLVRNVFTGALALACDVEPTLYSAALMYMKNAENEYHTVWLLEEEPYEQFKKAMRDGEIVEMPIGIDWAALRSDLDRLDLDG